MEAKAIAKGVRISPRKVRLVTRLIVGKSVSEADVILSHLNRMQLQLSVKYYFQQPLTQRII